MEEVLDDMGAADSMDEYMMVKSLQRIDRADDSDDEAEDFKKGEARPAPEDEPWVFQDQEIMNMFGSFALILSRFVLAGVQIWLSGMTLLVLSFETFFLWRLVVGPIISLFIDPHNDMDRGWHNLWMRIHSFVSGTIAFVFLQVASDLFLSTWKDSGVTAYETLSTIYIFLMIAFGVSGILYRIPAAERGHQSLY